MSGAGPLERTKAGYASVQRFLSSCKKILFYSFSLPLGEFDPRRTQNPLRTELSLPSSAGLNPKSTPTPPATGFGQLAATDLQGASSAGPRTVVRAGAKPV